MKRGEKPQNSCKKTFGNLISQPTKKKEGKRERKSTMQTRSATGDSPNKTRKTTRRVGGGRLFLERSTTETNRLAKDNDTEHRNAQENLTTKPPRIQHSKQRTQPNFQIQKASLRQKCERGEMHRKGETNFLRV